MRYTLFRESDLSHITTKTEGQARPWVEQAGAHDYTCTHAHTQNLRGITAQTNPGFPRNPSLPPLPLLFTVYSLMSYHADQAVSNMCP